ncbi:Gfo/Idh/MocA family oxidoreductase [Cnuibacter physcomitrellae]|uniref:Gfo/Idh/MocA family protein n=1 Tax=Cnuibacter physcomitrellae TaxID=1619308 RepID=UPI0021758F45|nr:Gfo/Idh/MocA family oxidoreductase [Cnuibacter physcomitrellae]MCS5497248.1 Gfo/Idh/MocA family oxidoreductase [Cnuibacter physcomitrellae]
MSTPGRKPAVALVGASGYGRRHLDELLDLHRAGAIELCAVVDIGLPAGLAELVEGRGAHPHLGRELAAALEARHPTTVVIATPPHTHAALAEQALAAGCSVYLEKPPVPLLSDLHRLLERASGRRLEVGFQQTPGVVAAVRDALSSHPLGPIRRITGFGALQRPDSYYTRARWAGRRELDGRPVFDGALFNPLAHVVHAALSVASSIHPGWTLDAIEAELASVRPIQSDDLAAVRARSVRGPEVTLIGTTAADRVVEPTLLVVGERGRLTLRLRDLAGTLSRDGADLIELPARAHRSALRAAVLDPRGPADPLLDASAAEPFVRLVSAVVDTVGRPAALTDDAVALHRDGERFITLPGITDTIERAAAHGSLLAGAGRPLGDSRRRGRLEEWSGAMTRPYDDSVATIGEQVSP